MVVNKIIWTENIAYAVGVIASDGNLSKSRKRVQLKCADFELVSNLKKSLNIKEDIKTTKTKTGRTHYYIMFTQPAFYDFLISIGIGPKKSHSIKHVLVPKKFFNDFLRGLFDGDGTFYTFWDTRWKNSFGYQISFSSASKAFISWLKKENTKNFSVKGFIRKGKNVYNLRYVKGDTRNLFKMMYYDKRSLSLARKRVKMIEAFKKEEDMKKKPR